MTTSRRRSPIIGFAAVAVAFSVLVGLGIWQVERLAWKRDLIARVEARIAAPAEPLPDPSTWPSLRPDDIEYRPVRLAGTFDHDREIHVFIAIGEPKGPFGGQGYFVVTPVTLDDGHVVFVNRGFVPLERKDPATRPDGQVTGRVEIEGLMRPPEKATWLSPEPDLGKNVWFVRDPQRMAEGTGVDPARVAPFTVDARAGLSPGGLPQGGESVVSFPNNHLGYALTWFGLAAVLVGVTIAYGRKG
jgi:surfeit locus 1 family protein